MAIKNVKKPQNNVDEEMRQLAYERFSGKSMRARFMKNAYKYLMEREPVTTVELLAKEYGKSVQKYLEDRPTPSTDPLHNELKNAMSELKKLLTWKEGEDCWHTDPDPNNGQCKIWSYLGKSDDPLSEEMFYSRKIVMEDYIAFCKSSEGFFPDSWFTHFFSETPHLRDKKSRDQRGEQQIKSAANSMLKNIDLLPDLFEAIHKKQVLQVRMRPFVQAECDVVFHPQYLKEYNGRWFAFGYGVKDGVEVIETFNLPLDRIVEIRVAEDVEYISAEPGFWDKHFENIIGVTHGYYDGITRVDQGVQNVVIRTHSPNCHGRITTKLFHSSQVETKSFGEHTDGTYGEITLTVEPNNEFVGRILQMGTDLEVIAPIELRNKLKNDLETLLARYK